MRPLRLLAALTALFACLAALAVAGCGNDSSSSSGLGTVLSYVPEQNAVRRLDRHRSRAASSTSRLDTILHRFPGADTIKALLKAQLSMGQEGVDFDKDIKPLLGNPAVISATDVTSFLSDTAESGFVAALQVKDKDALDSLVEKTGAKKQGEVAGATVYQDQDTSFAVNDDVVVLAGSRELLDAALKRADAGDGMSEERLRQGARGPARRRPRAGLRGRAGPARPERRGQVAPARSSGSPRCARWG